MADMISPATLHDLLEGDTPRACIDVREPGEYNSSHIPGVSLLPRRLIEFQLPQAVPFAGTQVVVCDDDGRRAALAAATVEGMGYSRVAVLEGGINRWVSENYPTEWGTNVPSKDFGEKVEVVHHVPEIDATDLQARMARGDKLHIIDTRTPEEFQRFCIPGGRSVPGGELALRITDIVQGLEPDTTVVVNCAGRTRSIIGTRLLQRMGLPGVCGLKNGTAGWVLAGYELETGADRLDLPEPSADGLAAAESFAAKLAEEDGVHFLDVPALQAMLRRRDREPLYFIDVRGEAEYAAGHIPGFRWFPGGQAVQRSDDAAVVKPCPVVFACDGKARATSTASWYRQMGFPEVYVVDGGTAAWSNTGLALERGTEDDTPAGLAAARAKVRLVAPQELHADPPPVVIFVDTSQDFARAHPAGAQWVPRGWLEFRIGSAAPSHDTPVAVTCNDGRQATLAGAALADLGYRAVAVLDGGMAAWRQAALPVEQGLAGVMSSPDDVVLSGPDRNFADMMHYLRWEEALGVKYGS
ncbi:MAG: rhodanese-like domain-containing protein [Candidatus Tectomicrobia bacterium]|nr:rhodanese-like domain-containing protein [Candidatus Tectomicrobia bacterium]